MSRPLKPWPRWLAPLFVVGWLAFALPILATFLGTGIVDTALVVFAVCWSLLAVGLYGNYRKHQTNNPDWPRPATADSPRATRPLE